MTENYKVSRRDLRERAFKALFSLEYGGELVDAAHIAYHYDKEDDLIEEVPVFLLNLIKGVKDNQSELDDSLSEYLKAGWNLERLTLTDKVLLRLALYEIRFEDTPAKVVVNETIDIAKKYSDKVSAKFINGILTKFVVED